MTRNMRLESDSEHVEKWRPCPFGFEDLYEVSSLGRVRRSTPTVHGPAGRVLTPATGIDYRHLKLYRDRNTAITRRVHLLVAEAFVGPKPGPGWEVNHKNADNLDNRAENLEWVTKRQNESHAVRLGVKRWKANRGHLTIDAVRFIRANRGMNRRELAEKFAVTQFAIYDVLKGKTWSTAV